MPWLRRGHWQEGERWHKEALALAGDAKTTWVCQGLTHLGTFIAVQGRYAQVAPLREKARTMLSEIDDPRATIEFSVQAMQAEAKLEDARKWFMTHITLLKEWKHPMRDVRLSAAYGLMGDRLRDSGYFAEAKEHYYVSLELDKTMTGMMSSYTSGNLGRLALQEGKFQEAYELINQSVTLSRSTGSRVGIADWTRCLGEILFYKGDLDQAEVNFEESQALYEEIGNVRATTDLMAYLIHVAILQENWELVIERLQIVLPVYIRLLNEFHSLASGGASEDTMPFVNTLFCVALLCEYYGKSEWATIILGHALLLREKKLHNRPESQLQAKLEKAIIRLQNRLGDLNYNHAFQEGQSMSVGELLNNALECIMALSIER